MRNYLILLPLLFVLMTGCASLEQNAYRTVGSVTITVEAARAAFIDYVNTGKSNAEEQAGVRALYERYQASMRVMKSAVMKYRETGNEGTLQGAMRGASDSASAFISAVNQFTKPNMPPVNK